MKKKVRISSTFTFADRIRKLKQRVFIWDTRVDETFLDLRPFT